MTDKKLETACPFYKPNQRCSLDPKSQILSEDDIRSFCKGDYRLCPDYQDHIDKTKHSIPVDLTRVPKADELPRGLYKHLLEFRAFRDRSQDSDIIIACSYS